MGYMSYVEKTRYEFVLLFRGWKAKDTILAHTYFQDHLKTNTPT